MRTKVSVALNGVELHAVDEAIILQSVNQNAPNWNISAVDRGNGRGQRVTGLQKRFLDVLIVFAIDETDPHRRSEILSKVSAWAEAGGELTVSYRERQRLRVTCVGLPQIQGVEKFGSTYQVTLRAYSVPMWEDMDLTGASVASSASGSAVIRIAATGGGVLSCRAENGSGSVCNTITIGCNGRSIQLTGAGLASGETLIIDYTSDDIQRIIAGSGNTWRSLLAKRTTASFDDILLSTGENTVSFEADAALNWTLYTFGRWIG